MADLPLSKTLDPADLRALAPELAIVDEHFDAARLQHPLRRWEYAMALRAYRQWCKTRQIVGPLYDVGGSGSPFYRMLDPWQVGVIDPNEPDGKDLAAAIQGARLGAAVFCLSVLEHVDDLDRFWYHLACLVAPGGLLFLTVDYCDWPGLTPPDTYHFHWMRKRIFNSLTFGGLTDRFLSRDFSLLGPANFTWQGPQVYDYTFASLALIKRA